MNSDKIILIENGITVSMDPSLGIITNGYVVIEDDTIKYVGRNRSDALKVGKPDIKIDATKKIIFPGLINVHNHVYQILLKDTLSDLPYAIWDNKYVFPMAKYINKTTMKYAAYIAAAEMLESGTTTVADTHYFHTTWDSIEGIAEAFKEIGIRNILAWGILDTNAPDYIMRNSEESIKHFLEFRKKWTGINGLTRVDLAPVGFGMTKEETLIKTAKLAEETKTWIHIHASGTQASTENIMWTKMVTEPQYYAQLGLITSRTIVAHAIWLSKEDITLLSEKGASVAHNPMSNLNLAFGIAPVVDMLEKGITVALGTDGLGSYTQDLFNVMRTTLLIHKLKNGPTSITAKKVLEMATIDGAKALGLEKTIGSVTPGKKADLLILDLEHPNTIPLNHLYPILANSINPKNIETVFVNGRIVVENKKVITINTKDIYKKTQKISQDIWNKCRFT